MQFTCLQSKVYVLILTWVEIRVWFTSPSVYHKRLKRPFWGMSSAIKRVQQYVYKFMYKTCKSKVILAQLKCVPVHNQVAVTSAARSVYIVFNFKEVSLSLLPSALHAILLILWWGLMKVINMILQAETILITAILFTLYSRCYYDLVHRSLMRTLSRCHLVHLSLSLTHWGRVKMAFWYFKMHFLGWCWISNKISLKYVIYGPIDSTSALVQVMATNQYLNQHWSRCLESLSLLGHNKLMGTINDTRPYSDERKWKDPFLSIRYKCMAHNEIKVNVFIRNEAVIS